MEIDLANDLVDILCKNLSKKKAEKDKYNKDDVEEKKNCYKALLLRIQYLQKLKDIKISCEDKLPKDNVYKQFISNAENTNKIEE